MRLFARRVRWDLLAVAAAALLFVWATTPPSAFFLHVDAADQDFAALAWARGCWEYSTEKFTGVLLLAPLFRVFGPSPAWETAILALLAAVSVTLVYELGRLMGRARLAGAAAALLLAALPTFQYFSRTQIGYVFPCLLLAWLAIWHRRWGWAGLFFSLTVISHFGYAVIVAACLATLACFYLRRAAWKDWLRLGLAGLAPVLALEALYFAYMGRPFQWTRGTLAIGLTWSGVRNTANAANWDWALTTLTGSNGWLLTALLALSLLAPLGLRRDRTGLALWLAGLLAPALYTLAALRHDSYISRPLAPLYLLWAIGAGVAVQALLDRLPQIRLKQATAGLVLVGLAALAADTGLFIREFTRTPFGAVEGWLRHAAQAGRPVRYNNVWVSLFYAQVFGLEVLTGDGRWIEANEPGQAVLIFDEEAPAGLDRTGYTVDRFEVSARADARYPVLTREAILPRAAEVWWPSGPSQSIQPEGELPPVVTYYAGTGCVTPPAFGNGTLHFYQLTWRRLVGGGG